MSHTGEVWEFVYGYPMGVGGGCYGELWEVLVPGEPGQKTLSVCVKESLTCPGHKHKLGYQVEVTIDEVPAFWKLHEPPFVSWVKKVRKEAKDAVAT